MNLIEYADREMLNMNVANVLASELRKCLTMHDHASFAVPGGTTPGPIFELMSTVELDWSRVRVMLTDERWVAETNSHSNARLVKKTLLNGLAAQAQFIPYYREGLTAAEGAAEVAPTLAGDLPISLLLLGMGGDMHTASLFPCDPELAQALAPDAPLLCPATPTSQDTTRVTLPLHVLQGAMSIHLAIFGEHKRAALERAQSLPPEEAPVGAVLTNATVHWAA
ncbi:6-phosphogluconolactonase [Sulfitobacter sp. F26204]|uniref:6-phosphogluconolactonase n=1 Tax=Sulfitobacter sp. F26204 TaxID=2996014 RepID=UPI00225E0893|nr:6-phosphogluconolactonase [Sulfitobacter sp. F26204]MCX7559838.1 6-phosphogluconolactonase [Sulfitobacter sp. F26204]